MGLAQGLTPYIAAAISAYGAAVLTRLGDGSADSTVDFGRRVLRRLTGGSESTEDGEPTAAQIALAHRVGEVASAPHDADAMAALRWQVRMVLNDHPDLAAEIAGWPRPPAPGTVVISTTGDRAPAVHTNNGIITTGDITSVPGDE